MRRILQSALLTLFLVPLIGCTGEFETSKEDILKNNISGNSTGIPKKIHVIYERPITLFENGDVFIINKKINNKSASYFSAKYAKPDEIANRIIFTLKEAGASDDFIKILKNRLKNNRRIQKDNFTLPLIGMDNTEYQFQYISQIEQSLYTLNYKVVE